jgi:type VI secretion system protein ImpH
MANKPLNQVLFDEPFSFEFFQAVRLFEKLFPERKAVGREALPHEEVVRFRSRVALDFPSSEVHEIRDGLKGQTDDTYSEMVVNFMGLVGVSGVLPIHYTELVLDRIRHRDTAMWSFLDIFTHRSVSMFYQAWSKYRFPVNYERGKDEFTAYLFDFAGLGTNGLAGKMGLNEEALLPYTGLISQKPHSQNCLQNILSDYFDIIAKAEQFEGQWLDLGSADYTLVGVQNCGLGKDTIAGTRVWNQQSKFKISLGPLPLKKFKAFLPNGDASKPLGTIIRFLVGNEYDFDVQLVLQRLQVPGLILTTRAVQRPMLGWTTWLKSTPFEEDDDQVVLGFEN